MEERTKPSDPVTLITDGQRIVCDKTKLKAASSYFRAMFSSDMIESEASEVNLKGIDSSMLRILVNYAESSETVLEYNEQNVQPLLQLACMLQFNKAVTTMEQYLMDNVTYDNCCSIMDLTDVCGLNALYSKARKIAEWWFDEVSQMEQLLELSYDIFHDLMSSDTLCISCELNVLKAAERWVKHNYPERCEKLSALFSCIHWTAISEAELTNFLEKSSLFFEDNLKQQALDKWKAHNETEAKPKPRCPPEVLVVLGGEWIKIDEVQEEGCSEKKTNPHLLEYDTYTESPKANCILTSLPEDYSSVWGYEACVVGKDIYVMGGEKKGPRMRKDWYRSVWCYDSLKETWKVSTEMPTPRRHHSIAVSGDFIYVIGGFGRHRIIQNTVDRYDTIKDTWEKQPSLAHAVFSAAACTCNDKIYVITDNIEILEPASSAWIQKSDILPPNVSIQCAVSHSSNIYMLAVYIKCFYIFDSLSQQITKLDPFWQTIGKACVIKDKIFIVGGDDNLTIEYYTVTNQQTGVTSYDCCPLRDHHVLALPRYPEFRKTSS